MRNRKYVWQLLPVGDGRLHPAKLIHAIARTCDAIHPPRRNESLVIVVLFSSVDRPDIDADEYGRASARMREIVSSIPGLISFNSYVLDDGEELAVARFDSLEAVEPGVASPSTSRRRRRIAHPGRRSIGLRHLSRCASTAGRVGLATNRICVRCSRHALRFGRTLQTTSRRPTRRQHSPLTTTDRADDAKAIAGGASRSGERRIARCDGRRSRHCVG